MKRIEEIEEAWESKKRGEPELWYRGLQKSAWPLVPKLYRPRAETKDLLNAEDEIREEFVRRAPSLTAHKPANAWEWYYLMQHYGAPTRLLDWTENAQVGLYFAVKDSDGLHDGVVWVLDPWWLNEFVLGEYEVVPPGSPGLAREDARRYQPWLPDRFDAKERLPSRLPVAIYPTQFDVRIAAQRSCFTIHARRRAPLEELFPKSTDHLARIVIPSFTMIDIRSELDDYRIDEATVFPDLEGLGKCVSSWLPDDNELLPHEGTFTRLKPSPIHGVGVFAVSKIKKGTPLFPQESDEMLWVEAGRLPKDKQLRQLYDDFAVVRNGKDGRPKEYGCPRHFQCLTMSWYLNDPKLGEKPNVWCDPERDYEFLALRNIKEGEELTVDSNTYSDHARFSPMRAKGSSRRKTTAK